MLADIDFMDLPPGSIHAPDLYHRVVDFHKLQKYAEIQQTVAAYKDNWVVRHYRENGESFSEQVEEIFEKHININPALEQVFGPGQYIKQNKAKKMFARLTPYGVAPFLIGGSMYWFSPEYTVSALVGSSIAAGLLITHSDNWWMRDDDQHLKDVQILRKKAHRLDDMLENANS